MKSPSGITIMINDVSTDLAEVSWYEKAPCGFVCGASVAYSDYGRGPSRIVISADQAANEFWDTKREREKYERLGFTFYPDRLDKATELMSTSAECPHTPKFGVPPRPEVDGYVWAAVHDATSRSPLMHLVPTGAVEDATERRYGSDRGLPLCGRKRAFWWKTEWYALDGKVECSRCVKKATSIPSQAVSA